jgi:hypothetical protein
MRITIGLNLLAAAALLSLPARADRRSFIRAYEFQTQPQGNLEFELWNDVEAPKGTGTSFSDSVITHRIELEYGITDRWDSALYHVFQQGGPQSADPQDRAFHFDSWRLETRYRLAEKGEWPVDVMVYLEGERPAAFADPWELEEKVILERDFGPVGLVVNLVAEQKLASGDRGGHLWELDAGVRYEVHPKLRLAAEVWGIQTVTRADTQTALYAGPSVSVAVSRFWLQLGAGIGLNDAASGMQLRSVLGFNL